MSRGQAAGSAWRMRQIPASTKVALALGAGLVGMCALFGILGSIVGPLDKRPSNANMAAAAASPSPSGTPEVPPSEQLSQAKKALADNYKPHKDPMKTTWGRVGDARRHLEAIPADAREHAEAQKLLTEVRRREEAIARMAKMVARQLVIEEMEKKMLSEGMDFKFTVSGPERTVLRIEYVLMSRPLVYKLTNETDFLTNMRGAGFKKVTFTDGYYQSWTYDLD